MTLLVVPARADLTLVDNGAPACTIVIPADASEIAAYAAAELQGYLQKMSGADVPVVAEGESDVGGVRVLVGPCGATAALGIDVDALGAEEFIVRTTDDALVLVGADRIYYPTSKLRPLDENVSAGTLFAVYDLLQDQLGVRWLWPGESGEVYPSRATITVGQLDVHEGPKLLKRAMRNLLQERVFDSAIARYVGEEARDSYVRKGEDQWAWNRRMRLGRATILNFGHAFTSWWERYGEEHPEYFALHSDGVDGDAPARVPPHGNARVIKMCVSQPALWDQIIANWQQAREQFADTPEVTRTINACENDGGAGFCICENCRAWDVPGYYSNEEEGLLSLSDRYVHFWNELARRARAIDPEAWVCGYSYSRMSKPPLQTRVEDGVMLAYVGSPGYPARPQSREHFHSAWRGWADMGASQLYRPNVLLSGHAMPIATPGEMGRDFQWLYRHDMIGTDFDSLVGDWATAGPNYYVLGRLHWDPDADVEAVVDEWYSAFGDAEEKVREYFDYWTEVGKRFWGLGDHIRELGYGSSMRGRIRVIPEIYAAEDFETGRALLAEAAGAVRDDERCLGRVRFLQTGLEHARLTWQAISSYQEAMRQTNPPPETLPKLVEDVRELIRYRKRIADSHAANTHWATYQEIRMGDLSGIRVVGQVVDYEPISMLPYTMKFNWDPDDVGGEHGWFRPEFDDGEWGHCRTERPWEQDPIGQQWKEEHGEDYDGVAWYRTAFYVPEEHHGRRVFLFFNAVDGDCDVWINGEKAGSHPLVEDDDWKEPFSIEITGVINDDPAAVNRMAVRVNAEVGNGGIYKRVWLVTERAQ